MVLPTAVQCQMDGNDFFFYIYHYESYHKFYRMISCEDLEKQQNSFDCSSDFLLYFPIECKSRRKIWNGNRNFRLFSFHFIDLLLIRSSVLYGIYSFLWNLGEEIAFLSLLLTKSSTALMPPLKFFLNKKSCTTASKVYNDNGLQLFRV